ncbi:MAG: CaiB/BaiF CoA-transferase family protein [Pseudolabrys sp.]|nr:CaiB/BaiF CoA-transferase family protein [Pseudolabrys sp.]MDP2293885.1 CaiB/BaiF CoA-transferase family protein [Pseudolabrys sp.]
MRPLEGITVLDFSTLLPGPMATLILAEAGAEVIKIERPGRGEEMRTYQPKWGADSVNFAMLNRGKKSLTLDLKNPEDRAKLGPLIARADVVIEQFRPGVMARLGLDYESLSQKNPRIIYCAITGYGQTGPKRADAGHDLNYIGDAGLLALSMGDIAHPVVPPALIADIAGGAYPAVMNIMFALMQRQRTGRGCQLDIAMAENLFPFTYWAIGEGLAKGKWPGNGTALVCGGTPRYRLYPTIDGQVVAAAPIEQKFWDEFCELIGLEAELRDDSRDIEATTSRIAEILKSQAGEHWRQRFAGRDCCCTIVADLKQALEDPHFRARGVFDHVLINEKSERLPALPVPVVPEFRSSSSEPSSAPLLGANNSEFNV